MQILQNNPSELSAQPQSLPQFASVLLPVFIVLTVIWNIVGTGLNIDGAMRIPFLLGLLSFCCAGKNFFTNRSGVLWFCWCAYALINVLTSECGINREAYPTFFNLVVSLYLPCLLLAAVMAYTQLKPRYMLPLMFFSLLLSCAEMVWRSGMLTDFSLAERMESGEEANRVNANEIGIYLAFLLTMGMMYYYQNCKKKTWLLIFAGIIFLLVLRTASRTAFLLALLGVGLCLFLQEKKIFQKLLPYAVILIVIGSIAVPYLEDAAIFERLKNTESDTDIFSLDESLLTKYMGDRAVYYYGGSEVFMQYPVCGVGYHNYIFYNPFSEHVCHVEIMAQLSEEGILGTAWFLLFLGSIAFAFYETRQYVSSPEWKFSMILFILICAVCFASYVASRVFYFLPLGYIIGNLQTLEAKKYSLQMSENTNENCN